MKSINQWFVALLALLMITLVSCEENVQNNTAFNLSYAFGAKVAMSFVQSNLSDEEKNADKFVEGFKVGLKGDSATIMKAQQTIQERMGTQKVSETTENAQNIAYNLGVIIIGGMVKDLGVAESDFDLEALKNGYTKSLSNDSLLFTTVEIDSIFEAYMNPKREAYQAKMQAKQQAEAAVSIEEGVKFMKENGEKEGVITTESGLQYEIVKAGNGPKPIATDKVKTHYHGTLIDGTIFDSSVDRGEPATFGVGQVIKGWQEGIPLMSVGAKYRFYIPQDLAYGMQSPSPKIPAGSTLIFDVELIEINPK
ncbi:MAG: FKBP-type peptidyl-prolyl cis-trans isomerase [Saprospiraceae bacterium]|nr:FKBP-type peptidyl-prolyl cis-trans isomerase [Saprospiraceae bacterium]